MNATRFQQSAVYPVSKERRGVVLIVVLVLVVMIALAGFGFLSDMTTEYEAARINGTLLKAQQTLASAESYVFAIANQASDPRFVSHNPDLFHQQVVRPVSSNNDTTSPLSSSESWRFSVLATDQSSRPGQSFDLTSDSMSDAPVFGLTCESAKLHLATVLEMDTLNPGAGRRALMQLPGMSNEAADSILDWIDEDDEPREFGAESEYYSRQRATYQPSNRLPDSLSELLFVRGIERNQFYDQNSWPGFITVVSREKNLSFDGRERFPLNQAERSELESVEEELAEFLSEELARFIRLARLYGLSQPTQESGSVATPPVTKRVETTPLNADLSRGEQAVGLFDILNVATLVDASIIIPASKSGSSPSQFVKSPLSTDAGDFAENFRLLEQYVTTHPLPTIMGRININLASELVLRSLLDDAEIAAQIVTQRDTLSVTESQSLGWLVQRGILGLPKFREVFDDLTVGGNVFSAEIIAYRNSGGPYRRQRMTFDATEQPVRKIEWLDLTAQGVDFDLLFYLQQNTDTHRNSELQFDLTNVTR